MKKKLALLLGIKTAVLMNRARKKVQAQVRRKLLNSKGGRALMCAVRKEAVMEVKRFRAFAMKEFSREMKKARPVLSKVARRLRKKAVSKARELERSFNSRLKSNLKKAVKKGRKAVKKARKVRRAVKKRGRS